LSRIGKPSETKAQFAVACEVRWLSSAAAPSAARASWRFAMNTHLPLRYRFVRRTILSAMAAGALLCGLVVRESPAAAQVVEVAPPALRVEAAMAPPAPHLFWVGGYWGWYGNRYCWIGGHWERERPGWAYAHPYWAREGSRWRFARGHWHRR
jgi:hypothetical protein